MTGRRRLALIVEDQPFLGLVAADILEEEELVTCHAHDPTGAMDLLSSEPEITLVLTDLDLGGSNSGLELAREILTKRPTTQIVLTWSGAGRLPLDLPDGVALVRKPYSSAQLRAVVSGGRMLQEV
jgi:CheY-like chemotaxis protein